MYDLPAEVVEDPAKPGDAAASAEDTLQSVLQVDEGETVYDYAWYPGMLVSEPASCVFACTARVSLLQHVTPFHAHLLNCLAVCQSAWHRYCLRRTGGRNEVCHC